MCTGLELVPLLVAAAGSGVAAYGAHEQQKSSEQAAQAEADARNAELFRLNNERRTGANDKLAEQSRSIFDQRVRDAGGAVRAQATGPVDRTATLEAAVTGAPQYEVKLSGSSPEVVKTEAAKSMADALRTGKDRAKSLGKLGGYGDVLLDQNFANTEAGRGIGAVQDRIAGNLSILPTMQDYATIAKSKRPSSLGGVLRGVGNVMASAAPSAGRLM